MIAAGSSADHAETVREAEGVLRLAVDELTALRVSNGGLPATNASDALAALVADAEHAREKLRDIATRKWRDEGGRIAAAIARDGLAGSDNP